MYPEAVYEGIDPTMGRNIGLTNFRRSFKVANRIIEIFENDLLNKKQEGINIAVAGCSTGQQVYSYAMLCANYGFSNFQVDGYDVYGDRLEEGRKGWYAVLWGHEANFIEDQGLKGLAFLVEEKGLKARYGRKIYFNHLIDKSVSFSRHDFSLKPFPKKYDLIFATYVLYQQQFGGKIKAVKNLLDSLNQGGILVQDYFGKDRPSLNDQLTNE